MIETAWIHRKGFEVLHESEGWRLAIHAYEPEVNGLPSLKSWGRHLDSEEAFLLLEGKGWMALESEEGSVCLRELSHSEILIVEKGEKHAIILEAGASALIAENADMSHSVTEPIPEKTVEALKKQIKEKCI